MDRRLGRTLSVVAACLAMAGCYYVQAASGQAEVLRRSEPIERVLADEATPPATRKGLELAVTAREFAERELGLPASDSYRRYADLGRPYVLWNVVATPEFSVEPKRWCFPVAGCVSYRGYFREEQARREALRLFLQGHDVSVGGVPAYSTLGHLPDPVYGSMLGWQEARLVGTIFHELAHERLYVPGDSAFNEAFASVVEQEGVRRWFEARGRTQELERIALAARREAEFTHLLREARDRLRKLYASGLSEDEMRIEKQREFGRLKFEYERLRGSWGGYTGYDAWFRRSLNNAHLASVATYGDCVPGLKREMELAGSLEAFYARAGELVRLTAKQRASTLCVAAGPSPAAARRPLPQAGELRLRRER